MKKAYGFTIVELLIVIVVIAILAAISMVSYTGIQRSAAEATLKSDLHNAATRLGLDHAETGEYPDTDSELAKSDATRYEYSREGDGYCLSAASSRSGVPVWHISNTNGVAEGACSGHSITAGGASAASTPVVSGFTDISSSYGPGQTVRADVSAIANGSWMIAVFAFTNAEMPTAPAGWATLLPREDAGTLRVSIFAKIKQSSDDTDQLFGSMGRDSANGVLMWGSGSAPVDGSWLGPIWKRADQSVPTITVAPSMSVSSDGSLVISLATERTTASELNYTSITGATPWIWIPQFSTGKIQTIAIGHATQAQAGMSQPMTVTYPNSQASNGLGVQIAIPPAS